MSRVTTCRSVIVPLLIAAILVGVLTACAPSVPSEPPGITGAVTSLAAGDGRPASFLVEGPNPQPSGAIADKAQVNIPPATMFFGADGNATSLDSISRIAKGTRVRVWFQGPVAESYPVQGSAKAVQILGK